VLIVTTPDVCGGSARLAGTRIPVWTLVRMRQLGIPDEDILLSFPALNAASLKAAWDFAGNHAEEIEREIRENEKD
jgi:type III restriction enzyme